METSPATTLKREDEAQHRRKRLRIAAGVALLLIVLAATLFPVWFYKLGGEFRAFKPQLAHYATLPSGSTKGALVPGQTSGALPGKVICINMDDGKVDLFQRELPESLRARAPGDVGMIAQIHHQTKLAGTYGPIGWHYSNGPYNAPGAVKAYSDNWTILLVDARDGTLLTKKDFLGEPPSTVLDGGDRTGHPKVDLIIGWLQSAKIGRLRAEPSR